MSKKALKLKTLLIILSFIISGKTQLMAENLIETGSWIYLADNVMGGISVGSSESNSRVRVQYGLYGEYLLKIWRVYPGTHALFYRPVRKHKGIKSRRQGKEYFLHLRNRSSRLPWQYYQASFKTERNWKQ